MHWCERLQNSPIEVLEACENAVARAEETDEAEGVCRSEREHSVALMREFGDTLSKNVARIPKPQSIFIGEAERKPAYSVICQILGFVETLKHDLNAQTIELTAVRSLLLRRKRAHNEAIRILADVGAATRRIPVTEAFFAAHLALRARLNAAQENALRIAERASELEALLNSFCDGVLMSFCTRVEKNADLAHDGAACNPMALIRICGELRDAAEQFLRRLEKQ